MISFTSESNESWCSVIPHLVMKNFGEMSEKIKVEKKYKGEEKKMSGYLILINYFYTFFKIVKFLFDFLYKILSIFNFILFYFFIFFIINQIQENHFFLKKNFLSVAPNQT